MEYQFSSIQSLSLCPTLCDPTDCNTPGFPVHHQLPELAQTHVHQVGDAIQPSHPLSSASLCAFDLSQLQGLFQWVSSLHQVLGFQLQHQSFQWIQDWFPLGLPAVQGTLKSLLRGGLQSTGSQKVGHNWATNTLCSHQRGPVQQEDSGCPQGGTPSVEIVGSKALSSAFQIQKLSLLVKL